MVSAPYQQDEFGLRRARDGQRPLTMHAATRRTQQFIDQMTFHGQSTQVLEKNGGPPETRTPDPLIKSQLLYQLS